MTQIVSTLAAVLISAMLLLVARIVWSRFSPFDAEHELTEADNPAVGTALFGFLGAVVIVLAALLSTESAHDRTAQGLAWDLGELTFYGLVAIALLKLSGFINDRFILHRFENRKELVDDRNVGAGAVLCGSYLTSGLLLAGAFGGRVEAHLIDAEASALANVGHELLVGLAFFGIGQVAMVLYGFIYQRFQPVNVHDAIADDYEVDGVWHGGNAAAGIAFGGNLLALGVVVWGGARHDFSGWAENLTAVGIATGIGLVVLPLWRYFIDHVMLGKADLAKEIYQDRNLNAALIETVSVVGLAVVLALNL